MVIPELLTATSVCGPENDTSGWKLPTAAPIPVPSKLVSSMYVELTAVWTR